MWAFASVNNFVKFSLNRVIESYLVPELPRVESFPDIAARLVVLVLPRFVLAIVFLLLIFVVFILLLFIFFVLVPILFRLLLFIVLCGLKLDINVLDLVCED